MGTRNLTAVMVGGEYRIAQYGQWDGYPSGQGATVLAFCRKHLATIPGRDDFMQRLYKCRFIESQEVERLWREAGAKEDGSATVEVSNTFAKRHPTLHRNMAGKILTTVWEADPNGSAILLQSSIEFAAESLFCEWAYVVDLDKQKLEVFKGFNKEPLPSGERFASMPKHKEDGEYYPVKLIAEWSLDELPDQTRFVESIEKLAYPDEEAAQ